MWWAKERPFFARVPNCAWCNCDWHMDTDQEEWIYAAYLPGAATKGKRPDERWVWDRNYVGWLCDECAQDEALVRWFGQQVRQWYPDARFVKRPGTAHEVVYGT